MADTEYSKIQSALNKHLSDWASVPENVAYENTTITPPDSTLYLELEFSPDKPVYPTQGSSQSRETGVFTITVAGLPGDGWGSVYATVDDLVSRFDRETIITYSDVTVKVKSSAPKPGRVENGRYKVPVQISYYGYI